MIFRLSVILVTLLASSVAVAAPTTTTSSTSTSSQTSSAISRPTSFQVIARNSGTKWDGRYLVGTDQSLSNITFDTFPPDFEPTSHLYLPGTNKAPRLRTPDGQLLYGGYNCGDQQLCSYDGRAAFLTFGGAELPLYGYVDVLCSNVLKPSGVFHLACSVKATDGKAWYRKAIVNIDDGHVILIPDGAALPKHYSFVDMEVQPI